MIQASRRASSPPWRRRDHNVLVFYPDVRTLMEHPSVLHLVIQARFVLLLLRRLPLVCQILFPSQLPVIDVHVRASFKNKSLLWRIWHCLAFTPFILASDLQCSSEDLGIIGITYSALITEIRYIKFKVSRQFSHKGCCRTILLHHVPTPQWKKNLLRNILVCACLSFWINFFSCL